MKRLTLLFLFAWLIMISMVSDPGTKTFATINNVEVKYDSANGVLIYISGMAIDADGSPRAYHPVSDSGLDALANAGKKGNWWGIVTDKKGEPVIQGAHDPAPGFYVSTTSLQDASKKITDPARYVNSDSVPFFVLPNNKTILASAKTGDIARVENLRNGKCCYAIFADVGPKDKIGEGSIRLAANLGIDPNPRSGGIADSVHYTVFTRSGNGKCRSIHEIDSIGAARYTAWHKE